MSLSPLLIVVVVLVIALGAASRLIQFPTSRTPGAQSYPYYGKKTLFSLAERSFLGVLEQATDGRYRVDGKVRLADALGIKSGTSPGERQRALNRVVAKHVDFVLYHPQNLETGALVELDDASTRASGSQGPCRLPREGLRRGLRPTSAIPCSRTLFPKPSACRSRLARCGERPLPYAAHDSQYEHWPPYGNRLGSARREDGTSHPHGEGIHAGIACLARSSLERENRGPSRSRCGAHRCLSDGSRSPGGWPRGQHSPSVPSRGHEASSLARARRSRSGTVTTWT